MPKYFYDLHSHSDFSDGDWPPETVFEKAQTAGLKGLVLSDHNTTNGLNRAAAAASKLGLETLEGVEISCAYKTIDIHMVGLSIKFDKAKLSTGLAKVIAGNNNRVREMTDKINALGRFPSVNFNKLLLAKGPGGSVVKYDILREIKKLNPQTSPSQLNPLLQRGGAAYVPYGDWAMQPQKAVELIHTSGGIAILAHPGSVDRSSHDAITTEKFVDELIAELAQNGLDGIEAHYSKYTPKQEQKFLEIARDLRLLVSGGSDWHGELHHPEITFGSGGVSEKEFNEIKKRCQTKLANA